MNWKVINDDDFGVAQKRERVFIVGIRKDQQNCQNYQFPLGNSVPIPVIYYVAKELIKLLDIN